MKLQMELELRASAERAWQILGEGFGNICEWTSSLSSSVLEGELREGGIRCCVSSQSFGPFKAGTVKERLVEFDPSTMTYAYEAFEGLPGFVKRAGNRWSIEKIDEQRCIVRSDATLELKGMLKIFAPFMKMFMRKDLEKFVEEMRYRIEQDTPHPNV